MTETEADHDEFCQAGIDPEDLEYLHEALDPEGAVDPGDGRTEGPYDRRLVFRTPGNVLLKAGHKVTDMEVRDIVHVVGAQACPVDVQVHLIRFMDVNAFDMVHVCRLFPSVTLLFVRH